MNNHFTMTTGEQMENRKKEKKKKKSKTSQM